MTATLIALQGYEKALGAEHTSTLNTVNNLGNLYKNQGKLGEAEMYERALQGYEKALGPESVATYVPALNTNWGLGSLFHSQGHSAKARIMYSKAPVGYVNVLGHDHPHCQSLRENVSALIPEAENIDKREDSRPLMIEGTAGNGKRHRLFRKFGLR
ncbi:uncharacterized protein BDZ99DRAFT_398055 [Mytilinidion resinicola]|uniref:TPR-like protein n=1 Tax=Mytilinidion resinicola TaxID=574789 RepID=A0A6A6Y8B3_9PEZI|nr:uncharacterized protein BDZ99DRAFT_398055 [Mytilinidion resinicola]KAF2804375.1 hypothetical protein BDZ99DRAFT_398055 [Mytilinidion resinicola]